MHAFPDDWKELDTILCHDWLTGMRGGERVLEVLLPRDAEVALAEVAWDGEADL